MQFFLPLFGYLFILLYSFLLVCVAGISEAMLAGCCGVLVDQVRRQIYIIRTSGARLLSLVNDVLDAAALRQNTLVLRQEEVGWGAGAGCCA